MNQGGFRPSTTKDQDLAGLIGRLGDSTGWKIKESQHENVFTLRIIGHSYRGVWHCIAGFWDLQTTSFEIPWFLGQKNSVILYDAQLRRWCFHLQIACFYCILYVWYTGTVSHSSSMLQSRSCRSSYFFSIQTFSQHQTFRQDVFCHFIISETWYCNSISFT